MATTVLTVGQLGDYNTSTGVWSAAFGSIVTLGGVRQVWAQVDKTVPLTNTVSALTVRFSPGFTEDGTLTVYARTVPTSADFSATNPPNDATVAASQTVSFAAVPIVLTLPLTSGGSAATRLAADMRARLRTHTAGGHRFAVGFAWNGTGGTVAVTAFTATNEDEFTGWGNRRGVPGVDRAVRCPRCGNVTTERTLVRDGITRSDVCPDCFDRPEEAPNFRWPFRG